MAGANGPDPEPSQASVERTSRARQLAAQLPSPRVARAHTQETRRPRARELGAAAICPAARTMSPETVLWEVTAVPHTVTAPFSYGTERPRLEPEEGHRLGATAASERCESDHAGQRRSLTPRAIDETQTSGERRWRASCHPPPRRMTTDPPQIPAT